LIAILLELSGRYVVEQCAVFGRCAHHAGFIARSAHVDAPSFETV